MDEQHELFRRPSKMLRTRLSRNNYEMREQVFLRCIHRAKVTLSKNAKFLSGVVEGYLWQACRTIEGGRTLNEHRRMSRFFCESP